MVVSGNVRPTTRQMPLDSVILRLRVAPSIVVRDSIRRQFRFSQTAGVTERIIATSLEIGDTAAAVELLTENVFRAAHRLTGGMSSDGARRCH